MTLSETIASLTQRSVSSLVPLPAAVQVAELSCPRRNWQVLQQDPPLGLAVRAFVPYRSSSDFSKGAYSYTIALYGTNLPPQDLRACWLRLRR